MTYLVGAALFAFALYLYFNFAWHQPLFTDLGQREETEKIVIYKIINLVRVIFGCERIDFREDYNALDKEHS